MTNFSSHHIFISALIFLLGVGVGMWFMQYVYLIHSNEIVTCFIKDEIIQRSIKEWMQ